MISLASNGNASDLERSHEARDERNIGDREQFYLHVELGTLGLVLMQP
jgi:hypothetical protein